MFNIIHVHVYVPTCNVEMYMYLNVMCMYTMHNVHVHVPKCNVHNAQCTCT